MARIDKVVPGDGNFRARLGFTPVASEVGDIIPVQINGSGLVVKATSTACDGVIVLSSLLNLNDVVDVMTNGEIVDVTANDGVTGAATGASMYAGAGVLNTTAPGAGVNGVFIGKFVEAWRLIVRVQRVQG